MWDKIVTNITLYLTNDVVHSPVSSWNIQASSPRGDSSYSWVSVCALGHNLGKGRTICWYPLPESAANNKEYTKLYA